MFTLNAKFDEDSLLYLLSHFGWDGHTAHMLTQWHLPPPLMSTVKLSLFTHVHSGPLSLAARLHRCFANCSHYINNGWTFKKSFLCCYSITVVSIFLHLPSSACPCLCSHSQFPHCCPSPKVIHTCPLTSLFPSFHHYPPLLSSLVTVGLFHVSMPVVLFCSLVYFIF